MAFTVITTNEIATGESVKNTTLTKVKDNFDNLDERVTNLEGGSNAVYPPLTFSVSGNPAKLNLPYTGFMKTTINFNIIVTGVRILTDVAGSSGSHEIDIKYSRAGGAYTSIFTTRPSISFGAGNDTLSTNAVLDVNEVDLNTGDIIRLDIINAQTASRNFLVRIDYVKA